MFIADSVAVEELRYGDNDLLSSDVATLVEADLLVLLTSVDGLLHPETSELVSRVDDIDDVLDYASEEKGGFSVGGMATKLRAAQKATEAGVGVYIDNGRRPEQLGGLVLGKGLGTYCPAKS